METLADQNIPPFRYISKTPMQISKCNVSKPLPPFLDKNLIAVVFLSVSIASK